MSLVKRQPKPTQSDHPAVWDLVAQDMAERDAIGENRYGTRLRPHNGRDAMVDAYQEALDMAVYLRQAIYERDGKFCEWEECEFAWETTCGEEFVVVEGTPEDNGFNFCAYCGGQLRQKLSKPLDDYEY